MESTILEGVPLEDGISKAIDVSNMAKIEQAGQLTAQTEDKGRLSTQKSDQVSSINAILLVFRAMKAAKGILRDGLKETKKDNKDNEKKWEKISREISAEHKKSCDSQKSTSRYHLIPIFIQTAGIFSGFWLDSIQDIRWKEFIDNNTENRYYRLFDDSYLGKFKNNIIGTFETFSKNKDKSSVIGKLSDNGAVASKGFAESTTAQINLNNQADTTPLQMKSQAAASLHQNRGSDESSEKQQLSEVDRSMRDLMSQEAQIFQGSSGRG